MANEIWHSYDSALTLYAFIYRMSDKYIYDTGDAAFEAVGTWNDARAGECDVAMTASGDMHFASFPAVAAGVYYVEIRERAGASPDTDDAPVAQGVMYWDGSTEINQYTLTTGIADIKGTGFVKDTDSLVDLAHTGADGDTLEDISNQLDAIAVDQNIVLNQYDERK